MDLLRSELAEDTGFLLVFDAAHHTAKSSGFIHLPPA